MVGLPFFKALSGTLTVSVPPGSVVYVAGSCGSSADEGVFPAWVEFP